MIGLMYSLGDRFVIAAVSTAAKIGVGVGFGALAITVSAHVLLFSLASGTTLFGSTMQVPPVRGFA
jgi:hypothetical protein